MIRKITQAMILSAIAMLMIFTSSCNRCSTKVDTETDTTATDSSVVQDISYNSEITDIAMFIAGMPVDTSSKLYSLTQTDSWKSFSKRMDEKFQLFYNDVDSNIQPWINSSLGKVSDTLNTLFYPFSGPDYINADVFFPDMEQYIFFGLEPPGSLPDPAFVKPEDLPAHYKMYEQSIHHIIYLSFFRTHSMKVDLNNIEVDGTTPVLLIFMARAGKKIIDIKPFRFAEDGSLSYDSIFNNFKPGEKFQKGVEIKFRSENDPDVQTLIYFSIDISDNYIATNPGISNYLQSIDSSCAVYIKSASYLLHDPYFETIKSLILTNGKLILQDDSGMPYKFYDKEKWKVSLHGVYDRPIPIFSRYYQKELWEDYNVLKNSELPFRRGYAKKTNLQVARRK
jgi:hypothetical protein